MASLPPGVHPEKEKALDAQRAAYAAQDKAAFEHDPGRPKFVTTSVKEGKGDEPDKTEQKPRTFDSGYGRPGGGGGPVSNQQASAYLRGDMIGGLEQGLQTSGAQATSAFNEWTAAATAGSPGAAFGSEDYGALDQAMAPGATEEDKQGGLDILGTQYTGQTAENLQSTTQEIGTNLSRQQSKAMMMQSGAGVQAGMETAEPDMTPGERRAESTRYRTDPGMQQRIMDVQRTADVQVQKFQQGQQQAVKKEEESRELVASHREGAEGYLTDRLTGIEDTATAEAARRNEGLPEAQTALDNYNNRDHEDYRDLEQLRRNTPEGFLDDSVTDLLESPEWLKPIEARNVMQEVKARPEYIDIKGMPHMRKSAFYKKKIQHLMIDPIWLKETMADDIPLMLESGRIEMYINNPETRRRNGEHWDPSKDRTTIWVGAGANERGEKVGVSDPRHPNYATPEEWKEIIKLRNWDRLARSRRDAFNEAGFGEGGEYEAHRPIGYLAGALGEFKASDLLKSENIDWIRAGEEGNRILDAATITNVMGKEDRARANGVLDLLGRNQAAYDMNDIHAQEKLKTDMDAFLKVNEQVLNDRADSIEGFHDTWRDMLASFHDAYRTTKRKRRQRAGMVIVLGVLTLITAGAALAAAPAAGAALALEGTAWMAGLEAASAAALTAEYAAYVFAGAALNTALEGAGVDGGTIESIDEQYGNWTYKGSDVVAGTGGVDPVTGEMTVVEYD